MNEKIKRKALLYVSFSLDFLERGTFTEYPYFDLDAEIVYDVIKHDLPKLKDVLQQIVDDLKVSNQAID